MAKAKSINVIDKNGNRRAICGSGEEVEMEIKRLNKEKPSFAPFNVAAERTGSKQTKES